MACDQAKLAKSLVGDSERATRIELASSVWKVVLGAPRGSRHSKTRRWASCVPASFGPRELRPRWGKR